MNKTPDVSQLSTCCGKPLVWDYGRCEEPECTCGVTWWDGTCPMCGCVNADAVNTAERTLTPTEDMLLARIADLEARLVAVPDVRWRVTAEEVPPVGDWVLGEWLGASFKAEPYDCVRRNGKGWATAAGCVNVIPDRWMPIPTAHVQFSQGADVPKDQR